LSGEAGLGALVDVLVAGEEKLDAVALEDGGDVLGDEGADGVVELGIGGGEGGVVDGGDAPGLTGCGQILLEPAEHGAAAVEGGGEAVVAVDDGEVNGPPIEGVVAATAFGVD